MVTWIGKNGRFLPGLKGRIRALDKADSVNTYYVYFENLQCAWVGYDQVERL
jgi:hypothetical protein